MSEAENLQITGTGFIREKSHWRESEKSSLEYPGIGKAHIKLRCFRDPKDYEPAIAENSSLMFFLR